MEDQLPKGFERLVHRTRAYAQRRYDRPRRRLHQIVDALLALALIGAAIAYGFAHSGNFFPSAVTLSLTGPTALTNGAVVEYELRIANTASSDVTDVSVTIQPERGFSSAADLTQTIGTLAAGEERTVVFPLTVDGDLNTATLVTATVRYRAQTNGAPERTITTSAIGHISISPLTVAASVPSQVFTDEVFTAAFSIAPNQPIAPLTELNVNLEFPQGYVAGESDPLAWSALAAAQQLSLSGHLNEAGSQAIPWTISGRVGAAPARVLALGTLELNVLPQALSAALTSSATSTRLGSAIPLTLKLKNSSGEALRNLRVEWPTPDAWIDATSLPTLLIDELAPASVRTIELTLDVRSTPVTGRAYGESLTLAPVVAFTTSRGVASSVTASPLNLPLESTVVVNSDIRYYSADNGDQLGVGPLPPQAGATTRLWFFLQPSMYGASVTQLNLTSSVSPGARLTGRCTASVGSLNAAPGSGIVRWTVESLATAGSANDPTPMAGCELELMPTVQDVGAIPTLLSATALTAQSSLNQATIDLQLSPLLLSQSADSAIIGKTRVQAAP